MKPTTDIGEGRVCIFGLNYPPESTGIAPYVGALAANLAGVGYDVTAHVAHPHYPAWRIAPGHGCWRRTEDLGGVKVQRRLHYVPQPPRGLKRLLSEISFGIRIVAARWGSPRVVVAVSPPLFSVSLAFLRLRLTPCRPYIILWVQDIYSLGVAETQEGGAIVERITRWVEGTTFRAADRVVVIHPRFAELIVREFGVQESKVEVIRNWTHLPSVASVPPAAARRKLGWPEGVTLAVHTGNMGIKQGLDNIIDAARLADERGDPVHFLLVGDGGERDHLENYSHGVMRLSIVDPLSDEDYRFALSAADVLLVNEKTGILEMALPSKLTAYFDAERPIVAAVNPNGITASEIAASGAGVVVPAGDALALLNSVRALGSDPDAATRYATNGKRYRESGLGEQTAMSRWFGIISAGTRCPSKFSAR